MFRAYLVVLETLIVSNFSIKGVQMKNQLI